MKRTLIFLFAVATAAGISSCTKEKAPALPFNPAMMDTVSYSQKIAPLMMQSCATSGCHDAATNQNGYNLTTYANVSGNANDLLNAMRGQNGFTQMPFGTTPLHDTLILQFEAWILQGKQNN